MGRAFVCEKERNPCRWGLPLSHPPSPPAPARTQPSPPLFSPHTHSLSSTLSHVCVESHNRYSLPLPIAFQITPHFALTTPHPPSTNPPPPHSLHTTNQTHTLSSSFTSFDFFSASCCHPNSIEDQTPNSQYPSNPHPHPPPPPPPSLPPFCAHLPHALPPPPPQSPTPLPSHFSTPPLMLLLLVNFGYRLNQSFFSILMRQASCTEKRSSRVPADKPVDLGRGGGERENGKGRGEKEGVIEERRMGLGYGGGGGLGGVGGGLFGTEGGGGCRLIESLGRGGMERDS